MKKKRSQTIYVDAHRVVNGVKFRSLISLATLTIMVQKLSATDVVSSVGRLLVYTFVQSSIIKVTI